jgi:outer membrane protein OmpA-like peptidoglycan-associated protein
MMSARINIKNAAYIGLLSLTLTACFEPPFNDFRQSSPSVTSKVQTMGEAVATVAGTSSDNRTLINDLHKYNIEYVQYGDTMALIVPTDRYFEFNSAKLNDICYDGLNAIIKMLKLYPCSTIYVAGFTDNVGAYAHKKRLSQAQAEAMLTFLWANNIQAKRLKAEGFADKFNIGDNHLVHGSAFNRRIEIQWVNAPAIPQTIAPVQGGMK